MAATPHMDVFFGLYDRMNLDHQGSAELCQKHLVAAMRIYVDTPSLTSMNRVNSCLKSLRDLSIPNVPEDLTRERCLLMASEKFVTVSGWYKEEPNRIDMGKMNELIDALTELEYTQILPMKFTQEDFNAMNIKEQAKIRAYYDAAEAIRTQESTSIARHEELIEAQTEELPQKKRRRDTSLRTLIPNANDLRREAEKDMEEDQPVKSCIRNMTPDEIQKRIRKEMDI
jgi:hypothetical protein